MAIEGPLRELGIHDVFQLLDLSRKTGVLSVRSKLRHNHGKVYFERGAVVYAAMENNPHRLGSLLVRAGKLSDSDLERARDMQEQGDTRRLGEVLVEIGAITRRELERQVRLQLEEVIFEIMGWSEGYFSFVEGPLDAVPAEATIRISTESLLMEGARRIDEWSRIESRIAHVGVVPQLTLPDDPVNAGQVDLLPAEWEVVALIDGESDIRQIAHALARSEFDVAKTVFGLESAGVVTLIERPPPSVEVAPEAADVDDLIRQGRDALDSDDLAGARDAAETARARFPREASVYVLAGRVALADDRSAEAEEAFRRALRLEPLMAPAHRLLGDALARQGRLKSALEWWNRWMKLGEEGDEAKQEMARVKEAVRTAETLEHLLQGADG